MNLSKIVVREFGWQVATMCKFGLRRSKADMVLVAYDYVQNMIVDYATREVRSMRECKYAQRALDNFVTDVIREHNLSLHFDASGMLVRGLA